MQWQLLVGMPGDSVGWTVLRIFALELAAAAAAALAAGATTAGASERY
jgi:hypothetical protein